MRLRQLPDLEVSGKRALLRSDLNVPLHQGRVADDLRIRASIPTIQALIESGAKTVICCSHLGRPKGRVDPSLSLRPVADAMSSLLGIEVRLVASPAGSGLQSEDGSGVFLLENLRWDPREESNDRGFASELASLADVYVNDAFGAVHRAHASVSAVAEMLPAAAGLLLAKEVEVLSRLTADPDRPFAVVLGGAKVSDKMGVVKSLAEKSDDILLGGALANTFLAAGGIDLGISKIEADRLEEVRDAMVENITLPEDLVVSESFSESGSGQVVETGAVPPSTMALDIGPRTAKRFADVIAQARTVLWNGPMGVFEWDEFSGGTKRVANAIAECPGFTVVGGGDSANALKKFGLTETVDHLSTGGGASLQFLEGRVLPGLTPLEVK